MRVGIQGVGIWGRGMRNWDEFCALVAGGDERPGVEWRAPVPDAIPARERRRSPLMVKLAVEVAHQACDMAAVEIAGFDRQGVATVFASSIGDTEITDYMCRMLATGSKILSPTRFHNSVHNAPAGYWSISAGNREPSSSIAGSWESFPLAMLEAGTLSVAEARPVLLVVSDICVPAPLGEVYPIGEPFGAALLLDATASGEQARDDQARGAKVWEVSVEQRAARPAWPGVRHPLLRSISEGNPAARCLALLESVAGGSPGPIQWPLNDSACLQMTQVAAVDGDLRP